MVLQRGIVSGQVWHLTTRFLTGVELDTESCQVWCYHVGFLWQVWCYDATVQGFLTKNLDKYVAMVWDFFDTYGVTTRHCLLANMVLDTESLDRYGA